MLLFLFFFHPWYGLVLWDSVPAAFALRAKVLTGLFFTMNFHTNIGSSFLSLGFSLYSM